MERRVLRWIVGSSANVHATVLELGCMNNSELAHLCRCTRQTLEQGWENENENENERERERGQNENENEA